MAMEDLSRYKYSNIFVNFDKFKALNAFLLKLSFFVTDWQKIIGNISFKFDLFAKKYVFARNKLQLY